MDPSVHRFSITSDLFYQTVLPSSTMVVENLAREPSCRKMSFLFFKRGPGGELKLTTYLCDQANDIHYTS